MKFKNKYKQKSFDKYLEKTGGHDFGITEDYISEFNKLWKLGTRIARGEYIRKLANEEISKNADLMIEEFLSYKNSKIKAFKETDNLNYSFDERIQQMNLTADFGRLQNFINIHGYENYEGSTLLEYFELFSIGLLDRKEFYDIIKHYKEANPDKMTYSGKVDDNPHGK